MRTSWWRRRWRWIAGGVLVVLVALLIGGRAWIRGQEYIVLGGTVREPDGASVRNHDSPTPGGPERLAVVDYEDGAPMRFGFAVRNDGPFKVRVTEVARAEPPNETVFMFRPTETRVAPEEDRPADGDVVPFRPFSLEPGHERYVEVLGELGDCEYWMADSSETIAAQSVRFEVWGQSLEQWIPLDAEIEIRLRSREDCPRPQVTE
jgi:hypothetical protein